MPESVVVPQLDRMALPNGGESLLVDLGPQSGQAAASNFPEASENDSPPVQSPRTTTRDSAWLQVEVCRDFRRDTCPRGEVCRFAHPEAKIIGKDGKVTCCYDFLKGRCKRDFCKYYHPPSHIKEKLISAGKQFGAMMMRYPVVQPVMMPDGCGPNQVAAYCPAGYTDRLRICQDFLLGQCLALVCPFVHPGPYVYRNADQTVTVCRNFASGMCVRGEHCRFYHPLAHHFTTRSFMPTAAQGFIGQPHLLPVMSPPPPPVMPMGIQFPFSLPVTPSHVTPSHVPVSLGSPSSFVPPVPMVPILSPVPNTSVASFIPAQPVMIGAPVSIIESSTIEGTHPDVRRRVYHD